MRKSHFTSGQRLGNWVLDTPEGSGGNGEVWRAVHTETSRSCAVKILHTRSGDSEPYKRFRREVATVLELQNQPMLSMPHARLAILPIVDAHLPDCLVDDSAWFAMPLAVPIRHALSSAGVADKVTAIHGIALTLADLALREIHHRDIKPENLYQHEGEFVLGDFGLVKRPTLGRTPLTEDGRMPGPFAYMPNEAFVRISKPDWEKLDVYCLAKTLWVLLANQQRPPFGQIQNNGPFRLLRPWHPNATPLLTHVDSLIALATSDAVSMRPTASEFAALLGLLPSASGPRAVVVVGHDRWLVDHELQRKRASTDTRVLGWLVRRWQSDSADDHEMVDLQTSAAILHLTLREFSDSLRRLFVELINGRIDGLLADVRPCPWAVPVNCRQDMTAKTRPILHAIASARPASVTVELRDSTACVGTVVLKAVEALRLLDYAIDSLMLKVEARERTGSRVTFIRPRVIERKP